MRELWDSSGSLMYDFSLQVGRGEQDASVARFACVVACEEGRKKGVM
jgi:hypothetical protein